MNKLPTLVFCLSFIGSGLAWAADNHFVSDAEPPAPKSIEPAEPWREAPARIPPWPNDADLVEFTLDGPPNPFRYFIDGRNLSVGPDGVVRYTLVAQGRGGARNLSFEGLRCTLKGSYKVFAYGAAGRFTPVEGADWQPIPVLGEDRYRQDLWRYHFCAPRGRQPRPKKDMLRSLRGEGSPTQPIGFQAD